MTPAFEFITQTYFSVAGLLHRVYALCFAGSLLTHFCLLARVVVWFAYHGISIPQCYTQIYSL